MLDEYIHELAVETLLDGRRRLHVLMPRGGWPAPLRFSALWPAALLLRWRGELTVTPNDVTIFEPLTIQRTPVGDYVVCYRSNARRCATALDALRFVVVEFAFPLHVRKKQADGR